MGTIVFFGCKNTSSSTAYDGGSYSNDYTITYKTADGVELGTQTGYKGSAVTFKETFDSKPGYKVTKYTDSNGTEVLSGVYKCTGNATITVTLSPITYKIKFEKNSNYSSAVGDALPETMDCEYDKEYTLPSNCLYYVGSSYYAKKSSGWTTNTDSYPYSTPTKDYENGEKILNLTTKDGDVITLYPKFKDGAYTLIFCDNSSSYYSYNYISADAGDVIPIAAIPTASSKTGYKVDGWYLSTDTTKTAIDFSEYAVEGNAIFYPILALITYTVTFVNEKGSAPATVSRTYGDDYLYLTSGEYKLADLTGFAFDGWYDEDGTKYTSISKTQTSDLTLTAKWKAWIATVNFYVGSSRETSKVVEYDKQITLPKVSGRTAGKYLAGWATTNGSSTIAYNAESAYTWKGNANNETVNLYAVLKDIPVNVTISVSAPATTNDVKLEYSSATKSFNAILTGATIFEWYVDGVKLAGETGSTLSVYKLTDAGVHSIMATTKSNSKILSGTLIVNVIAGN